MFTYHCATLPPGIMWDDEANIVSPIRSASSSYPSTPICRTVNPKNESDGHPPPAPIIAQQYFEDHKEKVLPSEK